MVTEDENGFSCISCLFKLLRKPQELPVTHSAVPRLSVRLAGGSQCAELFLSAEGSSILAGIAICTHFGGIKDQKTEPRVVKGVISAGEAQFRGNLGLEVLLYVKIVISKGMIEARFELGYDGLEFGKALEVTVDENLRSWRFSWFTA